MKKFISVYIFLSLFLPFNTLFSQDSIQVDTRIDNMAYWNQKIKEGLVIGNPVVNIPPAIFTGSNLFSKSILNEDSPDIAVNDTIQQTEASVFIDPNDNATVINSNNSINQSTGAPYGTSYLISTNWGSTWGGLIEGTTNNGNFGDPAVIIDLEGKRSIGYIDDDGGQSVDFSINEGEDWETVLSAENEATLLDKNHLWPDNSSISPFKGNTYNAWTYFGGDSDGEIGFTYSNDGGLNYSEPIVISSEVEALSQNQGINIQTGPKGNVYAVWAIYDFWNYTINGFEEALGFAKSTDGGETFEPSFRIIENIKGIRQGINKNMRTNSYPVMAVDISGRRSNGNIYVVWSNYGTPGLNEGTNVSVYFIKSENEGETWTEPMKINQGIFEADKEAYFPWITCDPETGTLSVIYYDDRNTLATEVETFVSYSYDEGESWDDFKISDVAFTPTPIFGLAPGYMGDYLGISARGGKVYPIWPDNRSGLFLSYCSPYETVDLTRPENLQIELDAESGQTTLTWVFPESIAIESFILYREGVEIATPTELIYIDTLENYGITNYSVSALYDTLESAVTRNNIQWGNAIAFINPNAIQAELDPNQISQVPITISNVGELTLEYSLTSRIINDDPQISTLAYCSASGGGGEYISDVTFNEIENLATGDDGYANYTNLVSNVDIGNTYLISIVNGASVSTDDLGVWIDWNQDGDFDDDSELVVCEPSSFGMGTYPIVVPLDATPGPTTMRIRIKFSGTDCGNPCGITNYGEVEDYSIHVNSWFYLIDQNLSNTIDPNESIELNCNFNSEGLPSGQYNAHISITSNDIQDEVITIPIVMNVTGPDAVNEITNNINWSIYPNPAKNHITMQGYSFKRQDVVITIYDAIGKKVKTYNNILDNKFHLEFELGDLTNGFYFISIRGENTTSNKKFFLEP